MAGFNGFGGFGGANMQNMFRQAQKMQEDMKKTKEEIEGTQFTGSSGGGMVECVCLGNRTLTSIKIKPEIVDKDDIEMLEDLVLSSVNDALAKIKAKEDESLPKLM